MTVAARCGADAIAVEQHGSAVDGGEQWHGCGGGRCPPRGPLLAARPRGAEIFASRALKRVLRASWHRRCGQPARSVAELVALAKARPGRLSYASTGIGGLMHLTGEFFRARASVDVLHVPYRGAAPAVSDAAGGQVDMVFNGLPPVLPLAAEGRLRILAVATPRPGSAAPEVPTREEAGLPGFDMSNAVGLVAPRGTPEPVVARLNAAANLAVADAGVRDTFLRNGAETIGSSPQGYSAYTRAERARFAEVIRATGVSLD
jgi:tripartite-type tricarboxylate transporter receptor subunit TctC